MRKEKKPKQNKKRSLNKSQISLVIRNFKYKQNNNNKIFKMLRNIIYLKTNIIYRIYLDTNKHQIKQQMKKGKRIILLGFVFKIIQRDVK